MTPAELTAQRKAFGFTQAEMAKILGMSSRGYQKLEAGESEIKLIHTMAVSYAGIMLAASTGDITKAPAEARGFALRLAGLITGQEIGTPSPGAPS